MEKVILDLCGGTGSWALPYAEAGYRVVVIDPGYYAPQSVHPSIEHIQTDVRTVTLDLLREHDCLEPHGVLAAPPCTQFAGSGARWWKKKQMEQPHLLTDALSIVDACLRIVYVCSPEWWALENPVGRLPSFIGEYTMACQPHEYAGYLPEEEWVMVKRRYVSRLSKENRKLYTGERGIGGNGYWIRSEPTLVPSEAYTKKTCIWGDFNVPPTQDVGNWFGSVMMSYGGTSKKTKRERSRTPQGWATAFFLSNP